MTEKNKLITLNRQRGAYKGQLTRIETFLNEESEKEICEYQMKLDNIRKIISCLDDLKVKYFEIVDDDTELEAHLAAFTEIEEEAEKLEVRLRKFLTSNSNNVESEHVNNANNNGSNRNFKLPDIPLPKFSGNYQDWYTFKDQFKTLIDLNDKLSSTQKLYYLKSTLSHSALDVVTADDTYESLFKALEDRFQNKRFIVNSHLNKILDMESSAPDAPKSLRAIVDGSQKHIRALKTMGLEHNQLSEVMLINIIFKKLDKETKRQFELSLTTTELPKWDEFIDFLQKRCLILENIQGNSNVKFKYLSSERNQKAKNFLVKSNSYTRNKKCVLCPANHELYKCNVFLNLNEYDRYTTARKFNLCLNCLNGEHKLVDCLSKYRCLYCSQLHHRLLCRRHESSGSNQAKSFPSKKPNKNDEFIAPNEINKKMKEESKIVSSEISQSLCNEVHLSSENENKVLLTTSIIYVENFNGIKIPLRAILDNGSQICLMKSSVADLLGLKRKKTNVLISGINGKFSSAKSKVFTNVSNRDNSFRRPMNFLITPKITDWVPSSNINIANLEIPENLDLADPSFGKPAKIDILIGAEHFYDILELDKQKISQLIFQKTVFGYIVSGTLTGKCTQEFCGLTQQADTLEENLQKFWKIESVEDELCSLSVEEQLCENHFLETYRRDHTGRFIVSMPLKDQIVLGESKVIAEKRLHQLWNRLEKNPLMLDPYCNFMKEYESLGHMTKCTGHIEEKDCYYLPHHGVYRPEKSTTKLRVVFNASSPTTNRISLNDILLKGLVNEDLYEIMTRFRKHRFVFLTDIEKMYRQILINPEQRKLLRILWKSEVNAPVETYELNTVTYGTSCAPFLAIRSLKQLAVEEAEKFSKASEVLLRDCYMDDVITGEDSLEAVVELQFQLIQILKSAGMYLHKWKSNHSTLLENVKENSESYSFIEAETKALGVTWNPKSDVFMFKVKIDLQEKLTKRTVLSEIARLFDPLGLIGPVITKAKTFMQELWKLKLDWNDPLPELIAQSWIKFTNSLKSIEKLEINRYILTPHAQHIELHGFADASSIAFGAVVYIQSSNQSHTVCNLISSKSQVAPLKTITIPRLELSACLLLSKLVVKILKSLKLAVNDIYLYTDSQIALAWMQTPPWKLKTFVSNRVAKIQNYTQHFYWKHVPSTSNPADLISRGLDAQELLHNQLWWHGPNFLTQQPCVPDNKDTQLSANDHGIISKEMKDVPFNNQMIDNMNICGLTNLKVPLNSSDFNLFSITNDFFKLIRISSYIHRFIHNCQNSEQKMKSPLTSSELRKGEGYLIKQVQYLSFSEDLKNLKTQRNLSGNSKLKFLNPFLDSEGLIRVGGRLDNSSLTYEKKHPIVLPYNHKLSDMIFEHFHKRFFHLGPQSLLHHVRQLYWVINGRSLARKVVHKCVTCFRNKPIEANQIMGNLPTERVNPSLPFQKCGVDFCGPFWIKFKNQRKGQYNKIYVALFVCLATKAIHLDLVTDLKTESFLATLKRFFARRGKSTTIMTDNGTTFIGTNNEIKKLHAMVHKPEGELANYLVSEGIEWKFIPPRSPNFGGLWEAGVKSFKYHLKRTLGNSRVTLEEFWTITAEIEGILNSRPLLPLSSDPNEVEVLTPAHFLIGRPIISVPEPDLTKVNDNRLSNWQAITKMTQTIWKKWQKDYLGYLQQRNKWVIEKENLKEGHMVILKEENLPPGKWALGRVIEAIPGFDKKVRTLKIKTVTGVVTRAISKVCPLPIEDNQ